MNYDKYSVEQLDAMRRTYARKLQGFIDEGLPIIYMDEVGTTVHGTIEQPFTLPSVQTSFSTWDTRKRAWFPKGRYLKVPVPEGVGGAKEERRSFTVFAAISTVLKKGYYLQFDQSTNKWGFNGFLENLALEIKDEYAGSLPVMVLGKLLEPSLM